MRTMLLQMSGWAMSMALLLTGPAAALTCQDPGGFDKWIDDVRREAAAQGIST